MQEREATLDRFDALFGDHWKMAYADAIGIDRKTVERMTGPTLKHADVIVSFLEATPPNRWPSQLSQLRALYQKQIGKDSP